MSTKYQRQIERILNKWAATPATSVADFAKQNRWPAGAPGSKGGQFAPTQGGAGGGAGKYSGYGSMFTSGSKFPGGDSPAWAGQQAAKPMAPPPGAKPHPQVNDKGQPVTINYPTKPSDKASWTDPDRTATFTPGSETPATLNGVAMKPWASVPKSESEWAAVPGQKLSLDARFPFEPTPGKSTGAGVIIREPDGRVWLTKPTNEFGGYKQTFPKGTVEHGLSMQASAIKETWEETGLQVKITGILGDYERTTSKARFYIAERVGGTPSAMGWESQAVRLSPLADMQKLLNMGVDKEILSDLDMEGFFNKAAAPKTGGKSWEKQARWPAGTPLGGQWKTMDGDGVTMPPTLAGGLTGSNSQYQKKANALYAAAKAGEKATVLDTAIALEKKVQENKAKGASSSHAKWNAQLSQFATQLASDVFTAVKATAIAERLSSVTKLSTWKAVGGKPGGSNPGGMYEDGKGQKWLVKGNAQYTNGAVKGITSDDRAKNEVLAARLMQAVGVGAPDMKLVDLEGQHGGAKGVAGSTGVASKWVDGAAKFNPNDPAHLAAARADFAVHAWLGNYDVMGMGYDNTVILNGKAVNIDPGGAILFRAQGLPKDSFGKDASEWETMRTTTAEQKAVFGKMTKSQLADSAAKLAGITDDTIRELVKTHGPGNEAAKKELADTLIARRDAILAKAGVTKADTLGGVKGAPAAAADTPAAEPPSIKQADTPAPPVPGLTKPSFDNSFQKAGYYDGLADKMLAAHAAGDMAALKAAALNKNGNVAWPKNTTNGKLIQPFFDTLVADLEKQKGVAAQEVAAGKATLTGTDGKTWVADDKGVLQPAAKPKISDTTIQAMMDDVVESQKLGPMKLSMVDPNGPTGKLIAAAKAGDINGVLNAKGAGAYFTGLKDKLTAAFSTGVASATTATAVRPAVTKPTVVTPTPAPQPAPKVPTGAAPDFSKAMLPDTNSNAPSHNGKVATIKALFDAGDEKGILALKLGTNTYGKKQAQLANDALAALGSVHQVTAGQASNSHPALTGGTTQAPAPKPAADAFKPKTPSDLKDTSWVKLTGGEKVVEIKEQFGVKSALIEVPAKGYNPSAFGAPPDFFTNGTQGPTGKWSSSKKEVNDANNAAVQEIFNTATQNGTPEKLKAMKFPLVVNGQVQMVGIEGHKAAGVKEYFSATLAELEAQLKPTYKTQTSGSMVGSYNSAARTIAAAFKKKDYADFKSHATKAADYLVLSKDAAASVPVPEKGQFEETGPSKANFKAFRSASQEAYNALSASEQKAAKSYTGSAYDTWNEHLRKGDYDKLDSGGKAMVKAFAKAAQEVPEGTILWRGLNVGLDTYQSVVGGLIQDGSFNSSSYGANPAFSSKQTWLRIHVAKGVKALDATIFSVFNSDEREVIIQNNVRYLVLRAENHKNFVDSNGKSWGSKNIVDVIALPHDD